nr:MAG TPA: Protein of unknown function (DUF1492) [Caudoviricetes sp.]
MKKICAELRRLGKKSPELLYTKLEAVDLTDLEFLIMKLRYIDGLDFKLIPEKIKQLYNQAEPYSDSWVFKVHKKALKKTVDALKLADWLSLII